MRFCESNEVEARSRLNLISSRHVCMPSLPPLAGAVTSVSPIVTVHVDSYAIEEHLHVTAFSDSA